MPPFIARFHTNASMVRTLGLSGLALASLLGTSPSFAAAPAPDLNDVSASEPVLVANLFRQIGDAIRSVGEIADTVNTVDSLLQQITGSGAAQSEPPTAPQSATPGTSPAPATAQSPGLEAWNQAIPNNPFISRRQFSGHQGSVSALSFSPDSTVLASSSEDGTIRLWDVRASSLNRVLQGHRHPVFRASFSPTGQILASGDARGMIKMWNVQTGEEMASVSAHSMGVSGLAFSPNGQILASSSTDNRQGIKLWSLQTGAVLHTLTSQNAGITSISFSPDNRFLASSGSYSRTAGQPEVDGDIRIWNVQTGTEVRSLRGHRGRVSRVRFSPNGRLLASSGADGTIKLWNAETGAEIRTLRGHEREVPDFYFSQNGDFLVSVSFDNTMKFWDTRTGENYRTETTSGNPRRVALSPDGRFLAYSSPQDGHTSNFSPPGVVHMLVSSSFERRSR
ncbi:MAG: WD40 repeat domain-containing protein [Leptolyngbya sp. LCM1.Bin17]|nr:MAG: WD40 repeat domain-containing protein [Leptolyngbya sp. LCM1.Bin17]